MVIENLVLWARSGTNGYAVNKCRGMMEHWNDDIMVEKDEVFLGLSDLIKD